MDEHDLLVSIDERVWSMIDDIQDIRTALNERYVMQKEFKPVKAIVYGGVGFMLTSISVILVKLFITG